MPSHHYASSPLYATRTGVEIVLRRGPFYFPPATPASVAVTSRRAGVIAGNRGVRRNLYSSYFVPFILERQSSSRCGWYGDDVRAATMSYFLVTLYVFLSLSVRCGASYNRVNRLIPNELKKGTPRKAAHSLLKT